MNVKSFVSRSRITTNCPVKLVMRIATFRRSQAMRLNDFDLAAIDSL